MNSLYFLRFNSFFFLLCKYVLYLRYLCRGVYSFRLSVRAFVISYDSVPFVELLQSFTLKFLKWDLTKNKYRSM